MTGAQRSIDHETIVQWVEERGGHPAHVCRTARRFGDIGVLRIGYPGYDRAEILETLDWDTWFDVFEANGLAVLHHESAEEPSQRNTLVRRTPGDELADAQPHRRGVRRRGRTRSVDLNTASVDELTVFWGVGRVIARRIAEYREQHGRIERVDELTAVKGIDEGTIANIKRQLDIGDPALARDG